MPTPGEHNLNYVVLFWVWDPKLKQFHLRKGPDDLLTPSRRPPKLEFEVQPRIVRTDEDIPVYTDEEKKQLSGGKKTGSPG